MVKEIKKAEAFDYLKKADEFLASAEDNLSKGRLNAAGFDATQAIINANDSLTIYFLERRASKDHREAVKFHIDVIRMINDSSCRDIIKMALEMRSTVGYLGKSTDRRDAENMVRSAARFTGWVKKYVK